MTVRRILVRFVMLDSIFSVRVRGGHPPVGPHDRAESDDPIFHKRGGIFLLAGASRSGDAGERLSRNTREFYARALMRHRSDVRSFRRWPGGQGSCPDSILAERNPGVENEPAGMDPGAPIRTIERPGLRADQSGLRFCSDGLNFKVRAEEQRTGADERAGRKRRAQIRAVDRVKAFVQRELGTKHRQRNQILQGQA